MKGEKLRLQAGGRIDRDKPIRFTFDGKRYTGRRGDTLASALLANGVRLMGRGFKYHRPRGVLTAGGEETNALVELRTGSRKEPNSRATTVEIFEGLQAKSQNRFPSLAFDLMAVNSLFSSVLVAGFYYKTFMWPKKFWEKLYEPMIRRAAGLGSVSGEDDPDIYEHRSAHCDVLVVGSGVAGLSAALAAGRSGARVILCEKDSEFGGRLLSDQLPVKEGFRQGLLDELATCDNVRVMKRTLLFGVYDGGTYGALESYKDHQKDCGNQGEARQIFWEIVARRLVVASGGIERPMVFGNNDLPGIMLSSAVRTYVERYAVEVGKKVIVATNNDDGWKTVETLGIHGISVAAVVDTRKQEVKPAHLKWADKAGAEVYTNSYIGCAYGSKHGVKKVAIYGDIGKTEILTDCVAVSGGWDGAVGLACQHGNRPVWNEEMSMFLPPAKLLSGMTMTGFVAGEGTTKDAIKAGHKAGVEASKECGFASGHGSAKSAGEDWVAVERPKLVGDKGGKAFIDFQHDVSLSDIDIAHREGYIAVEHLKRYTTLGMATDQGKLSNVNGLLEMARLTGKSVAETGTTMFRSPYEPVAIGALAGSSRGKTYKPHRLTPSHDWAEENQAYWLEAGLWMRAQWYVKEGETHWRESVDREVVAVRNGVGICDVTTLGKIEVLGSDAAVFLNRIYANPFLKLPVGKVRYGVMLREDGVVMDDGTTTRLADDHFVMTTTTANAGPVMQHLEYARQVLWQDLDVQLFSVSDAWAQFAVAGPSSRKLLERMLEKDEDISHEGFPFMGARPVRLKGGVTARLFRVSFSGEMAYEIALPYYYGDSFMRQALELGADLGIEPYGTEALGVMRMEKGHVAGPELNGTTTLTDLGLGMLGSNKKDYIGRVMMEREGLTKDGRWRVMGVRTWSEEKQLDSGGHLFEPGKDFIPQNELGYMASVCYSPTLGEHIGLALIKNGQAREGEMLAVYDPVRGVEGDIQVEVCHPVFYDKEGGRVRE